MKKIKEKKGETLVEILTSIAIIAIVLTAFPALIINIIKMNKTVKESNVPFDSTRAKEEDPTFSLSIRSDYGTYYYFSDDVKGYINEDGYYYYEAEENK